MTDADAIERRRRSYDEAAASWGKWAGAQAEQKEQVNRVLLAAAGVGEGHHVLDLASGVGEPAVTAARLVGERGRVVATDASVPMVAVLAERMASLGLPQVHCQVADMEALPFADGAFDAVTCRYGLMYARDVARTVAEAARVLKPGGRVAVLVWGPEEANPILYHGLRAANRHWGHPYPESEFGVAVRLAAPDAVAGPMRAAGLHDIREQDLVAERRIEVGTPFWAPVLEMNTTEVWRRLSPEQQQATHAAVAQAYEAFRDGEHYALRSHTRLISAARPLA